MIPLFFEKPRRGLNLDIEAAFHGLRGARSYIPWPLSGNAVKDLITGNPALPAHIALIAVRGNRVEEMALLASPLDIRMNRLFGDLSKILHGVA